MEETHILSKQTTKDVIEKYMKLEIDVCCYVSK